MLIGTGGGIGALLPTVAAELGLRSEIAKDAEIISSIGAALAMVREVVERVNPDPSSEDIAHLRAETLEAQGDLLFCGGIKTPVIRAVKRPARRASRG